MSANCYKSALLPDHQKMLLLAGSYGVGVLAGVANRSKAEVMPGVRESAVADPFQTSRFISVAIQT